MCGNASIIQEQEIPSYSWEGISIICRWQVTICGKWKCFPHGSPNICRHLSVRQCMVSLCPLLAPDQLIILSFVLSNSKQWIYSFLQKYTQIGQLDWFPRFECNIGDQASTISTKPFQTSLCKFVQKLFYSYVCKVLYEHVIWGLTEQLFYSG